ncbi:HigA family addiction module antitoxin [Methylobacterium sp. WL120]|uniref:HigA family addiction module antitoxin n=1 Tax=Methylobacterium sp. WL120 TaxID=2603887 RepID=UPI0011CB8E7E|nr:HigA family addiction module antitoxin [Methylobacterium sp. WL120]TXM65519.1 HigA family addiction module antidote protein [Methylobacterium sp. WL120]
MPEEFAAKRPNRAPTHPGAVLREDVLPALGITVTQLASHLKVTRQQIHRVLSESSDVSPEMAHRLGKLCGNGPLLWSRMQEAYSLWQAAERLGPDLAEIPTLEAKRAA